MSFPTFNGAAGEDAQEFLDNLEIACLVTGRDDDATRLHVFPLLMKAEAKAWFNTLLPANRGDWAGLRVLFLAKFGGGGETSESLWGKVCELRQGSLFEYNVYELQFVELWERWVASLILGEAAPNFLKKDRFVTGLCLPLREKVKGRFPVTWMDARDIARLKERKIRYQLQQREADQEEEGMAPVPPTNAPAAHRGQGNQDQQELLSRITHQLEDLSVHLVRGGRGPPPNQEQARGPRREAQEYHTLGGLAFNKADDDDSKAYGDLWPYALKTAKRNKAFNKIDDDSKAYGDLWPYALKMAKRNKVSQGKLCKAGNCIRETSGWSNPMDSLSVYAYIAKSEADEAMVKEKQKQDEETVGSSKRTTRSSNKKEKGLPSKPTPEVVMEKTPKDKKQGKPKGPSYKLKSDIELATKKKVFEECILNSKVEMTVDDILGIAKRTFHEEIIDIIKRK
ncbi:hypothetical protein L7F22_041336 [Adiantum nelumboides]|nr:hypothetical protein [Adiantum nelumboides]